MPAVRLGGRRFVILASRFNRPIVNALVRGACDVLHRFGVSDKRIRVVWVPGAFELPFVAMRAACARLKPDAIIALGALIRGQTMQYEVLANAVAQGLLHVSVQTGIPVTFGVIVAVTVAQAKSRAGGSMGNRGAEAALAAIDVLRLFGTPRNYRSQDSYLRNRF